LVPSLSESASHFNSILSNPKNDEIDSTSIDITILSYSCNAPNSIVYPSQAVKLSISSELPNSSISVLALNLATLPALALSKVGEVPAGIPNNTTLPGF